MVVGTCVAIESTVGDGVSTVVVLGACVALNFMVGVAVSSPMPVGVCVVVERIVGVDVSRFGARRAVGELVSRCGLSVGSTSFVAGGRVWDIVGITVTTIGPAAVGAVVSATVGWSVASKDMGTNVGSRVGVSVSATCVGETVCRLTEGIAVGKIAGGDGREVGSAVSVFGAFVGCTTAVGVDVFNDVLLDFFDFELFDFFELLPSFPFPVFDDAAIQGGKVNWKSILKGTWQIAIFRARTLCFRMGCLRASFTALGLPFPLPRFRGAPRSCLEYTVPQWWKLSGTFRRLRLRNTL